MHGRTWTIALGLLTLLGCTEPPEISLPSPKPIASSFNPATAGAIHGRVVWDGDVPVAKPMLVKTNAFQPNLHKNPVHCTLPHYPQVHNGGVMGAVVFLRGIDPHAAKPWDHPGVRIEFKDRELRVHQGKHVSSVGFVPVGGDIEFVNRDVDYHLLRARGAAFFAAPLQVSNQSSRRTLAKAGVVDLTSGAGYYWLHGHLFVAEHPYYAQTDADGRFRLEQVPAGTYELVCWMPSWVVTHREYDPEAGIMVRYIWAEPKEQMQTVAVRAGGGVDAEYRWDKKQFGEAEK
jgi:hypothetical protein